MCILCAVQKWSRQVATMLPWLVIPLVGLWALSQFLLPPSLRFEVTSARLACVLVLLATLFWYEILVPQLSLWRARHSARLRERRLSEVAELQKRRKSSTRCCRNCNNPYRDQNPGGGGRFMCSFCGHVSKRPKLDLLEGPLLDPAACGQDWPLYGFSLESAVVSGGRFLSCAFSYTRLAWDAAVSFGRNSGGSSDKDGRGFSAKKGEDGENLQESRGERARRKAEEKRQARLEKEMLEEEERKQREEVARLVEERRKLRDEMLEAEKESIKRSQSVGRRDCRKGTEKRRQDGRKDKDKGSSKSNSDCEELEKRTQREREGKLECDKKNESERRVSHKPVVDTHTAHPRDRVKVPFRSSFRGSATKASRPASVSVDHRQSSANRKDAQFAGHSTRKISANGDDRKAGPDFHRPMEADVQPRPPVQKKSWLQLFTRSSATVSPCPDASNTDFPNNNNQQEAKNIYTSDQSMLPKYSPESHIGLGQSLPFPVYPSINCSFASNSASQLGTEYMSPRKKDFIPDDTEIFEDPCFVPDPVSLLGPVSESLDHFPSDLGTGFIADHNIEEPRRIKNVHAPSDVCKPSPIESPLAKQRASEERHSIPGQLPQGRRCSNMDQSSNTHEKGTWQMWGGSSFGQDGLGLVGGASWLAQTAKGKSYQEDAMRFLPQDPIPSHIRKENHVLPGSLIPLGVHMGNYQNGVVSSPLGSLPDENGLWMQRNIFDSLLPDGDNTCFPLNQMDSIACNEVKSDARFRSPHSDISELFSANGWSKKDCMPQDPQEVQGSTFDRAHVGIPFPIPTNPDVQPLQSFN